jgi:hypothetical protein
MASRLFGFCLFTIGVAFATVAIATNLPWLIAENQRIEPWKIPIVWSSEAAAFVCFAGYGLRTLLPASLSPARASRLTLKAFFIAAAIDLAISIQGIVEERWAHSGAVSTTAQVFAGRSFIQWIGHRRYSLTCQFVDQSGRLQTGWYSLLAQEVPNEVKDGIERGTLPVKLKVAYDPNRPSRSWPADLPYSDNNRLSLYSLITLLFSGLLTANIAVFRRWCPALPPPEAGPFFAATALLLACGLTQGW